MIMMDVATFWGAVQQLPQNWVATQEASGSDLFILKNATTSKLIAQYQFKDSVTTFRSPLDHQIWYDIPFGNLDWWNKHLANQN